MPVILGYSTRYVYDGPHVIAEYDGNNNLRRKYIYGPGMKQIRNPKPATRDNIKFKFPSVKNRQSQIVNRKSLGVADANAVYYYHFDALGSVVALSDAAGDTVQTYEYSVYGEVAVEDANHPNPYMFAGVRYDIEIGLYYNRARYYNPFTGRFLQTDPVGYEGNINWYNYCSNNPLNLTDPLGLFPVPTSSLLSLPRIALKRLIMTLWNILKAELSPPYPGNWSLNDYFKWYFFGDGTEVDLGSTGLLPHIQLALRDATEAFEEMCVAETNDVWSIIKHGPIEIEDVNMGQLFVYELYDTDPPLVVLGTGRSSPLRMRCRGFVQKDGCYHLEFTYTISDPFDGVLSGGIAWFLGTLNDPRATYLANLIKSFEERFGEIDFPFSHPYNMTATWDTERNGRFQ